jgi:hypothetical protein
LPFRILKKKIFFRSGNESDADEPGFLTFEDKQLLSRFKNHVEPAKLRLVKERPDPKWREKLQTLCFDGITKNLERFVLHNGENFFERLSKLIANF